MIYILEILIIYMRLLFVISACSFLVYIFFPFTCFCVTDISIGLMSAFFKILSRESDWRGCQTPDLTVCLITTITFYSALEAFQEFKATTYSAINHNNPSSTPLLGNNHTKKKKGAYFRENVQASSKTDDCVQCRARCSKGCPVICQEQNIVL